jgi:hypothetical protein
MLPNTLFKFICRKVYRNFLQVNKRDYRVAENKISTGVVRVSFEILLFPKFSLETVDRKLTFDLTNQSQTQLLTVVAS